MLPSFAGGGAERAVLTLAGALPRDRAEPHLVVVDGRSPLGASVPIALPVTDLGASRVGRALPRLAASLRRIDPQVIVPTIGHLNVAVLALRPLLRRGVRIVPREANMPRPALETTRCPWLWGLAYRTFYPSADRVLCNATGVADGLVEIAGIERGRITVLPNPVAVDAIRSAGSPPRREPGAGRRFIAAGRLVGQKNFVALVSAASRLAAGDTIVILGDGPLRGALEGEASRLGVGDRVRFPGYDPAPWPWYAGADAFLLPSLWEGMPNAVLEALACGTPVIAAAGAGGVAELAAETVPGAVTLAASNDAFVAAMLAVGARPPTGLAPSLLPSRFDAPAAAEAFLAVLGL